MPNEQMTDEQKLAVLYDKADQLDREYEMAVSVYDIKGVWDFCRRCEENQREIARINVAQLREQLALAEKQRDAAVEGLGRLRDCDFIITPADRMDAVRQIARDTLASIRELGEKGGE